ncbi:MAG: DUF1648 domain-containing protein [Patescibacteria group bacterium]
MKIRQNELLVFALVLLSFGIGVAIYPQLPERVASHWNAQGQVDGYMSKFWGTFLMPVISLVLASAMVSVVYSYAWYRKEHPLL